MEAKFTEKTGHVLVNKTANLLAKLGKVHEIVSPADQRDEKWHTTCQDNMKNSKLARINKKHYKHGHLHFFISGEPYL